MGRKQEVIAKLFQLCRQCNDFVFDNEMVKDVSRDLRFGNAFDVTKIDRISLLPQEVIDKDYFIVHLGGGKHKFVKGINSGYHRFEPISSTNIHNWPYKQSILNEFDTSESNIISLAGNQRIVHDFIYEDRVANPKVYHSRRTKLTFSHQIGGERIEAKNLQMEIDLTMENDGIVTVFEGKNGFPDDFAVYQIFHPFKYYITLKNTNTLPVKDITCCYILRKKQNQTSIVRLYNYTFSDENDMGSIKLLKSAQYNLIKR